jgi:hypothetical protein
VKIKGLPATSQRAYLLVNSPNDFKSNESKLTVPDYFEIERLVEDLAKLYATACATSWFKVTHNKKPTREEFRNKVVEFMRHFDFSLEAFPQSAESDNFKKYAKEILETEIRNVLSGKNNEVEKRYKYYADYS